jgi:calcium-dependent protein kinase|mmetsp:Transcript_31782/g.98172  ORF Transcript_31782/g.98172 Transcript_31782/m.98172 type:complete len:136 (-) Transcript_31782:426-833(-)
MSASEALSHPWLSMHTTRDNLPMRQSIELWGALRGFAGTSPLQKLVLTVAAFHLTPLQAGPNKELFNQIDMDRSGTISLSDLSRAIRDKNVSALNIDDAELHSVFNAVDVSRSSQINLTEFVAATLLLQPLETNV